MGHGTQSCSLLEPKVLVSRRLEDNDEVLVLKGLVYITDRTALPELMKKSSLLSVVLQFNN